MPLEKTNVQPDLLLFHTEDSALMKYSSALLSVDLVYLPMSMIFIGRKDLRRRWMSMCHEKNGRWLVIWNT